MPHPLSARRCGAALSVLTSLLLATAAAAQSAGDVTVFRFPGHLVLLVALGALVAGGVSFLGYRNNWGARVTGVSALIAIFAGLLIAPSMAVDRVTVTPTEIEQKTGFWFAQTVKGFKYADVASIEIGEQIGRKRRQVVWNVHRKDGRVNVVDPGDLWEMNSSQIVPLLEQYGVTFE
jgi:hypothetical protein